MKCLIYKTLNAYYVPGSEDTNESETQAPTSSGWGWRELQQKDEKVNSVMS